MIFAEQKHVGKMTIATQKRGDHFKGITFFFKNADGTIKNLNGFTCRAFFKKQATDWAIFEFNTTDGTISIPNDASGRVIFLPRLKMEYPAGRYISDLELTDLLGAVETPFNIDWELTQDRTN